MHGFCLFGVFCVRFLGRIFQRVQLGLAALYRFQLAAHVAHFFRQFIDLAAVLASNRAQFEQPRFSLVQSDRIMHQSMPSRQQFVLRLARFDHRPVKRLQRLGQQGVLGCNPVQFARGHP